MSPAISNLGSNLKQSHGAHPIIKDWNYYSRTGNIWESEFHTGATIKLYKLKRPDLDEKHLQYVQHQKAKEQEIRAKVLRHKSKSRIETRKRLRLRQEQNLRKEVSPFRNDRNWSKQRINNQNIDSRNETNDKKDSTKSTFTRNHVYYKNEDREYLPVKDQSYYSGNGNLWEKLNHVPEKRFHLVVNERIVEADIWAAKEIIKRKEEEIKREILLRKIKLERVANIRNEFLDQRRRNMEKNGSASALERFQKIHKNDGGPVVNDRLLKLSEPSALEKHYDLETSFTMKAPDFMGLLHQNDNIRQHLAKFWQSPDKVEKILMKKRAIKGNNNSTRFSRPVSALCNNISTLKQGKARPASAPMFTRTDGLIPNDHIVNICGFTTASGSEAKSGNKFLFDKRDTFLSENDISDSLDSAPRVASNQIDLKEIDEFEVRLRKTEKENERKGKPKSVPFYLAGYANKHK